MPVIAMRVHDPNDNIISANSVEISDDDTFSKTIFLDIPFYEQPGAYKISFDYGKETSQIEFIISENLEESEVIQVSNPEILLLVTDKNEYIDGEFVTLSGIVSEKSAPTTLIGIYDPFGFPVGFYFGEINSDLEFTISFLIKDGVNFKTFGAYSAIAYYEESEVSLEFDYVEKQMTIDEPETIEKSETIEELEIENNNIPKDESQITNESIITPIKKITSPEKIIEENVISKSITKQIEEETIQIFPIDEKPKPLVEENNLSVEDVALGIMLNQITLSCDNNDFVDSILYYDGMGPALMRLCNFNEAIDHFDLELLDEPKNVQVLTNKGSALSKLGFHHEAISFFDQALEIEPNFLPVMNNKANTLVTLGNIQDAIENYDLILSLDPQFNLAKQNLEIAKKQLSQNSLFTIYDDTDDVPLDSITQITNKVADSTVNTVNKINQNPTNIFEQMGVVFSMIGTSFFSFIN